MIVFADFETYWDKDYTLQKMTPAEYILDPRFAVHGCAVIAQSPEGYYPPKWLNTQATETFFACLPTTDTVVVTFNALFDMCIVAWRYGYVPELMADAMGMARAAIGPALHSFSLNSVAQHLKLGLKGDTVLHTQGLTTAQIESDAGLFKAFKEYAINDVVLTKQIYETLRSQFQVRELKFADLVLRCAVKPQFKFDRPLLEQHLYETKAAKQQLLNACGTDKIHLMSAAKFKFLLEQEGVTVANKDSPTGNTIPALAKTDQFMQDLADDPNPRVQALAAARLGLRSTLEETRCQRMINIAGLCDPLNGAAPIPHKYAAGGYPGYQVGSAPIPLRYGAAHTHRLGGEWKINMQNMPRKSPLRDALVPLSSNNSVIVADLRQIEARMSAWFCGAKNLVEEFAANGDPYASLASDIFGFAVDRKVHVVEGFIGKTGILGLGYGAGSPKFHTMVHTQAKLQLGIDVDFTQIAADEAVKTYRRKYAPIPNTWYWFDNTAMPVLLGESRNAQSFTRGPITITQETIEGPNGLKLRYPDLHWDDARHEYIYRNGKSWPSLYGAKILENVIQFLARIVLSEAAVELDYQFGLRFALQAHDELAFVMPHVHVTEAMRIIKAVLTKTPVWCPGLPLDAEIKSGKSYGECK